MKKSVQKKKTSKVEQIYSQSLKFNHVGVPSLQPSDLILSLKSELEQEWKSKSIPFPICEIYSLFISTLPNRKSIIFMQKEITDLRSYTSLVQVCLKGINAREESLLSIQDMSQYLSKAVDWDSLTDIRIECAEILHAHRMLTLNVAESIERWKELFQYESSGFLASFIYNGENYLVKMRHDLDFLKTSELNKAFKFSQEPDPFLLFPSMLIEKHKSKVGTNYFVHNGQVVIPLPAILLKRVQKMDVFLREEENRVLLNAGNPRVLGCKGVIFSEDSKKQNESLAKSVAERIYRELINTQVNLIVNEQINDSVTKIIRIDFDEALEPLIEKIVLEALKEIKSIGNESNFFNTLSKAETLPPSPAENPTPTYQYSPNKLESFRRSSINAQNLQNFTAIEWYIRKLIEDLIVEADLESIVNQCISQLLFNRAKTANPEEKRRLTLVYQNLQDEKLSELVYLGVVNSFVEMDWVLTVASSMLGAVRSTERKRTFEPLRIDKPYLVVEEAEDYVLEVFTPGVHSPNAVSSSSEAEDEAVKASYTSEALNKVISEGKKGGYYELVSFEETLKTAFKSLEQYFKTLPDTKIFISLPKLKEILNLSENLSWFWLKDKDEIIGCLIFSNFPWENSKTALIHHFSTVSNDQTQNLLSKTQVLLTNSGYNSIIFNSVSKKTREFLSTSNLTPSQTLSIHFPWSDSKENFSLFALPDNFEYAPEPLTFKALINSSTLLKISESPVKTTDKTSSDMMIIGNRHQILQCILHFLTENSIDFTSSQSPATRLQRDIAELIEIITSLDSFKYPLLSLHKQSDLSCSSSLDLSFHFPNITTFPYTHKELKFQFIKLQNARLYKADLYSIFEVQTSIEGLSVFFILYPNLMKELKTELKGFKTDLFSKVDSVLKTLPSEFEVSSLSFPGFRISVEWDVDWIKGFGFSDEADKWVEQCRERVEIKMEFPRNLKGVLRDRDEVVCVDEFVFGLRHQEIDSALEVPFFACLVREENWIRAD